MTLKRLHHITVIDSQTTRTAWVRIACNYDRFSQSFTFRKYGGKIGAIAAALRVRDKMGKKMYGKFWPCCHKGPSLCLAHNNTSGITGVRWVQRDNSWVAYWTVNTQGKKRQKNVSFSAVKHGNKRAKEMAAKTRKEAVARMLVEDTRSEA